MSATQRPEDRLTALEEHAAFADRTVEQLSEEVAALGKRVSELAARLVAVERRLNQPSEDTADAE